MQIDLIAILQCLGGVIAGGGLGWLLKSNRRKAAAEADEAEAHADNAEWQVYKDQIAHLSELNQSETALIKELTEQHAQERKELEERFTTQTDRLRDVQKALLEANDRELALTKENGHLRLLLAHFRNWHCERDYSDCSRRKPEQQHKVPYTSVDESEFEEAK